MKSQFTNEQVNEVMESRGITRKSAVRFLSRQPARKITFSTAAVAPAKDFKKAAAHDVEPKPTDAGKARAEGLRLYKLAGRPTKAQFVKVWGKRGAAWTWEARAKAAGLASAEEAAAQFQKLLAKAVRG